MAFVLAVFMVFFASPWRLWIYPNQPDQDGLVAYLEQFLAALAIAYVPWMVRGIIRSVRAAPLQRRQLVQVSRLHV